MDKNHKSMKKKKKKLTAEVQFRLGLDRCSKNKDLSGAICLYESAESLNIRLNHQHLNSLLYICSNSATDPSTKDCAIEFGFRLFNRMLAQKTDPNEATITAIARLAAAKDDGVSAFELIKSMKNYGALPKLRSYGPALFCFCRNLEAEKAYEVEDHMGLMGIHLEEPELAALLKVSVEKGREEKVYEYLHKLGRAVRSVSASTAEIITKWFGGEVASKVGVRNKDIDEIKEAILRNGGGWHGLGWLGKGKWVVRRSNVNLGGCCSCGQQLACVDIDTNETKKFAESVASLALQREVHSNFKEFQDWLDGHSEYEAVVDGANVGLYHQNFSEGGFSISQLEAAVKELYNRGLRRPLVVLHNRRIRALLEDASSRELLQDWLDQGVLYGTPHGSNDDWYWLYAAVKHKCLLVTNDEMRDHIFELLGSSFFSQWKERHQVKYTFAKDNLKLQMPPSFSFVIQESEDGRWHVPVAGESIDESSRTWLCICRCDTSSEASKICNGSNGCHDSSQIFDDQPATVTGKRKER